MLCHRIGACYGRSTRTRQPGTWLRGPLVTSAGEARTELHGAPAGRRVSACRPGPRRCTPTRPRSTLTSATPPQGAKTTSSRRRWSSGPSLTHLQWAQTMTLINCSVWFQRSQYFKLRRGRRRGPGRGRVVAPQPQWCAPLGAWTWNQPRREHCTGTNPNPPPVSAQLVSARRSNWSLLMSMRRRSSPTSTTTPPWLPTSMTQHRGTPALRALGPLSPTRPEGSRPPGALESYQPWV